MTPVRRRCPFLVARKWHERRIWQAYRILTLTSPTRGTLRRASGVAAPAIGAASLCSWGPPGRWCRAVRRVRAMTLPATSSHPVGSARTRSTSRRERPEALHPPSPISVISRLGAPGLLVRGRSLVAFVDSHQPQMVTYGFYLDEDARQMTVVSCIPSASLERHVDIGGAEFKKLAPFIELREIEVFGRLNESAVELVHQKAAALGDRGVVTMHEQFSVSTASTCWATTADRAPSSPRIDSDQWRAYDEPIARAAHRTTARRAIQVVTLAQERRRPRRRAGGRAVLLEFLRAPGTTRGQLSDCEFAGSSAVVSLRRGPGRSRSSGGRVRSRSRLPVRCRRPIRCGRDER